MGNDEQQAKQQPPPRLVSRASLEWEATGTRTTTAPPGPGASLRARIAGETARARSRPLRPTILRSLAGGVAAAIATAILWALIASPHPLWALPAASGVAAVVGFTLTLAVLGRARVGYDRAVRDLRRQAREETRVAAGLEGLESAGWVLLHDRLVAAHRVPHVLVGPPGVVLVYPYSAGTHARIRYQLRRARVLAHSLLAWGLALPLVVLRVRPLPHLSAATTVAQIQPTGPSQDTAAWARSELAARLVHRPALDSWSVVVYAYYSVLNRPPDRRVTPGNRLGFGDTGTSLRTSLETGLPAGLNRAAVAFFATEVDDACPPA
jgi:hypothetical protein